MHCLLGSPSSHSRRVPEHWGHSHLAVWLQKWGVVSESCGQVTKGLNPKARRGQARVGKGPRQQFRPGKTLAVATQAATVHTHLPPGFSMSAGPPCHPTYPSHPHRERVFPVIVGDTLGSGRWGAPAGHGRPGCGPRPPEPKEALACLAVG